MTRSSALSTSRFRTALLRWYYRSKRRLPWRGERDPYRILVSEIMLQQTRVAVVEQRYTKFLQQFPTLIRLAQARQTSVLAAWSGLGYYRRARFLHDACRKIRQNGAFPRSAADLAQLPGIGRYTAAAVASIAFAEPVAVVDGNVQRVLQRCVGQELSINDCWRIAGDLLEKRRPGDFNQAMMELGATICLPGQPLCPSCPVQKMCASSGSAIAKRHTERRNKSRLSYLLLRKDAAIFLCRRETHLSLMPGMWELPAVKNAKTNGTAPILQLRHSITNTDYKVSVFREKSKCPAHGQWVKLTALDRLPLTGLTLKILRQLALV